MPFTTSDQSYGKDKIDYYVCLWCIFIISVIILITVIITVIILNKLWHLWIIHQILMIWLNVYIPVELMELECLWTSLCLETSFWDQDSECALHVIKM